MTRRCALILAVAVVPLAAGSCRDQGPSGPGAVRVRLTMPAANSGADGAILFTVSGPDIPSGAIAAPGLQVYHVGLTTITKYAVVGTLTNNATLLTIQVPDTRQQYSATLEQVSATNYQLRALTGYAVTVVR